MMFQREMRMMTTRRMKRKRMMMTIMTISRERLPKMRTMRGRRMMRMTPNLSTPTQSLPNVGLGASRLNKMNKSPP